MRESADRYGETIGMTDFNPEGYSDGLLPARVAADRSVLLQVRRSDSADSDGQLLTPLFAPQVATGDTVDLVPRIDAGLDSAHRFAILGAVFRPMKQFLRRTFDGSEDSELASDLGAADSDSILHD